MTNLNFSVDSALLRELGEKLVETVHLALAELVKNCYDADATLVKIIFSKDSKGQMQIVVSDNGSGMNFEAIKIYWMRIATTHKVNQRLSKVFGRPLSGEKGIGRFSCRRLGTHLKIITSGTKNGNVVGTHTSIEKTIVEFPWLEFIPGEDITTIICPGQQEEKQNEETGTELIITGVPNEWTERGYNWLKRQLAVLVANRGAKREGFKDDPGFNVEIIAPDFENGQLVNVRDKLLNAGWGNLKAEINKNGQAICKLDALGIGNREIISTKSFPHLKDVILEFAIMVDDRDQIRDTKVLSLGSLKNILDEWGGIQIQLKGVRVYPYGDDDWLSIDKDRGLRKLSPNSESQLFAFAQTLKGVEPGRSLINMLSMKSYVGSVYLGENATGFEPKLSREGFVRSDAVEELHEFVRFAIDWSTILRDYYLRQEALKQADIAKIRFEELINEKIEKSRVIESAINHLRTEANTFADVLPSTERKKFEEVFNRTSDVILKQHEANQIELTHLRLVASTSTLLLIFSHEVKSFLGILEQSKNSLKVLAQELQPKHRRTVEEINVRFGDLKDRLVELFNMTSLVGSDSKRAKAGQVALLERVKKVEKVFELITNKYNIDIDHSRIPNNIVCRNILEAEVYSILLNIISNSIKSVIAKGGHRKIELSAERDNGMNIIIIRDTGIGLHPSKYEEVFTPFISDPEGTLYTNLEKRINPEDNMIVGSGTGLGLGIVKEIVIIHGGSIRFKLPSKNWNSELEIKLP
ncbi:MAG: ATP-binding protein [Bacteroidales bacterium]|nr:ATP-binding protein [Bacteroidales bacterium]